VKIPRRGNREFFRASREFSFPGAADQGKLGE
jgi:hypothetical protein